MAPVDADIRRVVREDGNAQRVVILDVELGISRRYDMELIFRRRSRSLCIDQGQRRKGDSAHRGTDDGCFSQI